MRSDRSGFDQPLPEWSWSKRIVFRLASVEFPGASVRSVLASTLVAALLAMNIPGYAGEAAASRIRTSRITRSDQTNGVYGPVLKPEGGLASEAIDLRVGTGDLSPGAASLEGLVYGHDVAPRRN